MTTFGYLSAGAITKMYRFQVVNYLRAGKLLHLITILEILVIVILLPLLLQKDPGPGMAGMALQYYAVCFLLSLPVLSQLDARSRFQNFKKIKDAFYLRGFDPRILKPVLKSSCQRQAALLASTKTGYGVQCRQYFKSKGYRWYHLFPDFVFLHPGFVFTKAFWRTTFFAPYYAPLPEGET